MKKNNTYLADDEIELREIIKKLWSEKILILSISLIFMVVGYVYGTLKPKIYQTEIILREAPSVLFEPYRLFLDKQQQQQQQQQQGLAKEFNEETKLNLLNLGMLLQFYENNNKINSFKTYLKEKNINPKDYFRGKFNSTKDKNNYYLTYSQPLPGENFLNEYIIFIKQQTLMKYRKYLAQLVLNEINIYEQQLQIARLVNLENPILKSMNNSDGSSVIINEPAALFYKGTKVLSQKITHLNELLNETKNLTLDYNPIFLEASPSKLITKSSIIYAAMFFSLGLFFSLIIVFIRSIMHR
jgi:LPS O-antigen subunit length determinant protein (WzzB/FepE family)